MTDNDNAADHWLAAEMSRVWLLAEECLRRLQRAGFRASPGGGELAELEAIFAARRTARGGAEVDADDERRQALMAATDEVAASRETAPIRRVVERFGLTSLELEVLVIALAPQIDPPLGALYATLRGDPTAPGIDLALITELLCADRVDRLGLLDALDPSRPLLAWRLVEVGPGEALPRRAIRPTLDALHLLGGGDDVAPSLRDHARLRRGDGTLAGLALDTAVAGRLGSLLEAAAVGRGRRADTLPWLLLWGPRGAGKEELAARWAGAADRELVVLTLAGGHAARWQDRLRDGRREAAVRDAALYVGPLATGFLDEHGEELARQLDDHDGPILIGVETSAVPRWRVDRPLHEVEVPLPPETVRSALWSEQLPVEERAPDLDIAALARAFQLTPGEIIDAAHEARAIAALRPAGCVLGVDIRAAIDRRLRNELGAIAQRIEPAARWDDLVLDPDDRDRVDELVRRHRLADRVYREWGFGERIGYGKGLIALFSGPPGTGKTLLAGLIARELELELYQVDLSQVISKWVGETEKQLARLFDLAQRAHAVLLFDEADALFAKRADITSSHDRYGNLAVNFLLQRLEQYSGVAILTTNKDAALDPALQRRLSLHLRLAVPSVAERERLWRSMLPAAVPRDAGLDLGALAAAYELSGGHIKNAAVRAAFLAAADGGPLTTALMARAAGLELEDIGRLVRRPRGGTHA